MLKEKKVLEDFDFLKNLEGKEAEVISGGQAIRQTTGNISFLRVHDVGTGYGPPNDFLDAEVIVRFENDGSRAYGFQLRDNQNLGVAQAMFALLHGAFNADEPVTIEYREEAGRNNNFLFRVFRVD